MVDKHSQSFFGQSCGITIQSSSRKEPFIFLKCIQKKADGHWEKPSLGEGKTIKCNLDEIIMILQVLKRKLNSWTSYHNFNDIKTQISFQWENESEDKFWINIGKYSKMLNFAQVEIMKLLMKHLVTEKIEYATISSGSEVKKNFDNNKRSQVKHKNGEKIKTSVKEIINHNSSETKHISGAIKGETDKALLINFKEGQEIWVPKSTIHSDYNTESKVPQTFLIDDWVLKRNSIECS